MSWNWNESTIDTSRLASAKKKELTPYTLDAASETAQFVGSSSAEPYITTPDSCTCADFSIRGGQSPCKHMLRLAMEMGWIDDDGMQADEKQAVEDRLSCNRLLDYASKTNLPDLIALYSTMKNAQSPNEDELLRFQGLSFGFLFDVSGKKTVRYKRNKQYKTVMKSISSTFAKRIGQWAWDHIDDEGFADSLSALCSSTKV